MTKQSDQRVLLGFEIGSGKPVEIPCAHTVVTGLTQCSGKTTTLQALISRSPSRRAVAFITKRSESTFQNAHRIDPYFREQADWQFVESLLEATMRQRMKFERGWIMRVTRGAATLEQVYANLQTQLHGDDVYRNARTAKGKKKGVRPASGMNADIYMQLSAYFDILLPQLRDLRIGQRNLGAMSGLLRLHEGLNVMDLTEFSMEMQSLVIASTIDACYQMDNVTVVIPEAWEFLPQSRKTPVMRAGEAFVRKSAAAGSFLWLDSQDISGIEKTILKQVSVWILGNQREINEVEHTLKQLPVSRQARPKPEEIMHLGRGEFFVCYDKEVKKVYVCPEWLPHVLAQNYALTDPESRSEIERKILGYGMARQVLQSVAAKKQEDTNLDYKAAYEDTQRKLDHLIKFCESIGMTVDVAGDDLKATLGGIAPGPSSKPAPESKAKNLNGAPTAEPVTIVLERDQPEIEVKVKRRTVTMSDENSEGRLALLLAEGFFDQARKVEHLNAEFRTRGWFAQTGRPQPLGPYMAKLAEMGFVRVMGLGTYQSVPEMKVRIIES